jgi:hypothetical protein
LPLLLLPWAATAVAARMFNRISLCRPSARRPRQPLVPVIITTRVIVVIIVVMFMFMAVVVVCMDVHACKAVGGLLLLPRICSVGGTGGICSIAAAACLQ